jgi:hypothetical protein
LDVDSQVLAIIEQLKRMLDEISSSGLRNSPGSDNLPSAVQIRLHRRKEEKVDSAPASKAAPSWAMRMEDGGEDDGRGE